MNKYLSSPSLVFFWGCSQTTPPTATDHPKLTDEQYDQPMAYLALTYLEEEPLDV